MKRTAKFGALGAAVVMIVFVVFLAQARSATDQQARSPLLGKPAPALRGTDISGKSFDLISTQGKYTLVNFFASWCVPCQQEQPQLVKFASTPNRAVVGVLFQDVGQAAAVFMANTGGTWPAVPDDDGQHALDWGVRGPPESYLVAPDGIVVAKFVGEVTAARLEQIISSGR